jgi:hypothetical protein
MHFCDQSWVAEGLQGSVHLTAEEVVCCAYVNVVRFGGSAEVRSGDKRNSIWSFSLLCESHDDGWIVVRKEFDEFHTFDLAVSQGDGE